MSPRSASLTIAVGLALGAQVAYPQPPAPCQGNALLTLDDGVLVSAEWPSRSPTEIRGRAVINSTLLTEYTILLRPDGSTSQLEAGSRSSEEKPSSRSLTIPPGAVVWWDRLPSTLEQVVLRARAQGQSTSTIPLVGLSKDLPSQAIVERIDSTDWSVVVGPRRYEVMTDEAGCLEEASLASYGITFERRQLSPEAYPLEPAYGAPTGAPYVATEVKIPAPQGHVLGGTLIRPTGAKWVPAVVMITGISRHERNEGVPPYTPFRDIADVLGRAGIAVLRIDDRGVGASTGDFDQATSFDEADDVRTEVTWLRRQAGIDPKRIGLVGHSEGGFISLVVASTDPEIAAIASLAGSGVPGEQLNTWQTAGSVEHDPAIPQNAKAAELQKQLADRSDWTARDRAFVASDPCEYAAKVKVPALLLQGGSDQHVPPRSAERLATAMRSHGNQDVTVVLIPHLSHTLSPDPIGSVQAWSWLPSQRLSNQLLETLKTWLVARLRAT